MASTTFDRFFKFATVRNPWSRVVSLYRRREGIQVSKRIDFETFCEQLRYASDTCRHPSRAANQLDWMVDETGELAVDYVLRLEDLETGLNEIHRRTNGRVALERKHLNVNPKSISGSYRSAYSDTSRAIVAELFQKDIEFFGYEF
jgi:hypothetical protein